MNVLKEHSYIATWLSPLVAIFFQLWKSKWKARNVDVRELVVYMVLFSCLGFLMGPSDNWATKGFCMTIVVVCLANIMQAPPTKKR